MNKNVCIQDYVANPYSLRLDEEGNFVMDILDDENNKIGRIKLPKTELINLANWFSKDKCIDFGVVVQALNKMLNINNGNFKSLLFDKYSPDDNTEWTIKIYGDE